MDPPSLSELTDLLLGVRSLLTTLKPTSREIPAQTGDITLSAGSLIYCRPSRAVEIIRRIGERNVEIIDTRETEGFTRGSGKDPLPWTNEIYPTNIGPSCSGITSDMGHVNVTPRNNSITKTFWDPLLLFEGGKPPVLDSRLRATQIIRIVWINPGVSFANLGQNPRELFTGVGAIANPYFLGNPNVDKGDFISKEEFAYSVFNPTSLDNFMFKPLYPWPYETEEVLVNFMGQTYDLFDKGERYFVLNSFETPKKVFVTNVFTPNSVLPEKLSIYEIKSNKPLKFNPTPRLVYGSYDRKQTNTTGPPPQWGRTNLVQIKILRDVQIESRSE